MSGDAGQSIVVAAACSADHYVEFGFAAAVIDDKFQMSNFPPLLQLEYCAWLGASPGHGRLCTRLQWTYNS